MKKGKIKQKNNTISSSVIRAFTFAIAITLISGAVGALLLNQEMISMESTFIMTVIIWAASAFVGTILSINTLTTNPWLSILLTNLCYILIMLSIGILFFESNLGNIIAVFLAVIAGGIPAILLYINKKPKKNNRFHYR